MNIDCIQMTYSDIVVSALSMALYVHILEREDDGMALAQCDEPCAVCIVGVSIWVVLGHDRASRSSVVTSTS